RDTARAADRKARTRKRMPADKDFGQAEFAAERAHFVLEEFAQRLDQLELHALGQTADIVVRLDRHRRATGEGYALDYIGIERALRQEIHLADFFRFLVEDIDEKLADDLALLFGIGFSLERIEEG